jgi:hypothetical protein
MARCPSCAAALRTVKPGPPVDPSAYDEALDRFAARLGAGGGGLLAGFRTSGGVIRNYGSG